jgi:hypothetical protein
VGEMTNFDQKPLGKCAMIFLHIARRKYQAVALGHTENDRQNCAHEVLQGTGLRGLQDPRKVCKERDLVKSRAKSCCITFLRSGSRSGGTDERFGDSSGARNLSRGFSANSIPGWSRSRVPAIVLGGELIAGPEEGLEVFKAWRRSGARRQLFLDFLRRFNSHRGKIPEEAGQTRMSLGASVGGLNELAMAVRFPRILILR